LTRFPYAPLSPLSCFPTCGRVYIKTNLDAMLGAFAFARRSGAALANGFPLWNGVPRLEYPITVMDDAARPSAKP
jgi:hypothetical protein